MRPPAATHDDDADAEPRGPGLCARCGDGVDEAELDRLMLRELAEIGMDLARALRRQVLEPEDGPAMAAGVDPALAFSRLARAVRLTVALKARLDMPAAAEAKAPPPPEQKAQTDRVRGRLAARALGLVRREAVRQVILRTVETEARERGDTDDLEDRLVALHERFEDEADVHRFIGRPVVELVGELCRELGVTPAPGLAARYADWGEPGFGTPAFAVGDGDTPPSSPFVTMGGARRPDGDAAASAAPCDLGPALRRDERGFRGPS